MWITNEYKSNSFLLSLIQYCCRLDFQRGTIQNGELEMLWPLVLILMLQPQWIMHPIPHQSYSSEISNRPFGPTCPYRPSCPICPHQPNIFSKHFQSIVQNKTQNEKCLDNSVVFASSLLLNCWTGLFLHYISRPTADSIQVPADSSMWNESIAFKRSV